MVRWSDSFREDSSGPRLESGTVDERTEDGEWARERRTTRGNESESTADDGGLTGPPLPHSCGL